MVYGSVAKMICMVSVTVLLFACGSLAVKPNIVLVLTDDLGWNTAWNNDDIISPTLDTMSAEGLKLTSFYVYRYCSPTRAAFLTGRSPYKLLNIRENLIPTTIPQSTDTRFTMLPKRLAEAGYRSYQVGKWHQGQTYPAPKPNQTCRFEPYPLNLPRFCQEGMDTDGSWFRRIVGISLGRRGVLLMVLAAVRCRCRYC